MAPAPPFPRLQRGPARPAGVLGAEWVSVLGTWRPLSRTAAPLLWQRAGSAFRRLPSARRAATGKAARRRQQPFENKDPHWLPKSLHLKMSR